MQIIIKFLMALMLTLYLESNLFALSYDSNTRARFSTNSIDKNPILDGYSINKLEISNILFNADMILDDNEYIYNLNIANQKIKFYANLYTGYTINNHSFYLGYLPSVGSRYFYNEIMAIETHYFGLKALQRFEETINNDFYIISDPYLNNNSGLSAAYLGKFANETINFGISYTNNMNRSIRNYTTQSYKGASRPVDVALIYYNEYLDFGYGLNGGLRKYTDQDNSSDIINEGSIGAKLDFLGITPQITYLKGTNSISDSLNQQSQSVNISYRNLEGSIYYTISSFTVGIYYLSSYINGQNFIFKTSLTELDFKYQLSQYFYLTASAFYQNVRNVTIRELNSQDGVLVGLTVTL